MDAPLTTASDSHPRRLPIRADGRASPGDLRLGAAMRAHRDRLISVLVRTGLGSGDAVDVTQEAFWVLAQRLGEVPLKAERAFLMSTALRMSSDRRRSAWRRLVHTEWTAEDWSAGTESPEELSVQHHGRRRLDAALGMLADHERDVFILVELEGLSRSEAAHILHLPPGTVASRLARGRARLDTALSALPTPHSHSVAPAFGDLSASRLVGSQLFLTNPWGGTKAQGAFEQRLIERQHQGSHQTGWYWHWPGFERTVFAYPEVMLGWKPWDGGETTDARLPARVRDSRSLVLEFDVETRATGSYNLALSTWLTNVPGGTRRPRPDAITTEIMVWPDYSPGATPPGRYFCTADVAGAPYELWLERQHSQRFPGDPAGWTVLTLRGIGGVVRGRLPLGEMMADLASRGLVNPLDYVSCVELGNEVMGGSGTTFVQAFSLSS